MLFWILVSQVGTLSMDLFDALKLLKNVRNGIILTSSFYF